MAIVKLSDLRDLWKNISDWVTGANSNYKPQVQLTGSKAKDSGVIDYNKGVTPLAASTTETIVDVQKAAILENVSIAVDSTVNILRFNLSKRKPDGTYSNLFVADVTIGGWAKGAGVSVKMLNDSGGNYLWDLQKYDSTNNIYAFRLTRPLEFPFGFKLEAANSDSVAHKVIAEGYYLTLV